MYYIEDEYNPPHIHAKYNKFEWIFNIDFEELKFKE